MTSTNSTSPTSPLQEATPRSLDELFDADPQTLSDADIDTIVADLRSKRANFQQEKAKKIAAKAPPPAVGSGAELLQLIGLAEPKK